MNALHAEAVTGLRQVAWGDLIDELDQWSAAGRVAEFWWRDDDAVRPTPQLDQLLDLADGIPIGLAVIPAGAQPALAKRLHRASDVAVLQHGWSHTDHARSGKKSEYPPTRISGEVITELVDGRARLASLFGARALPIFVPPWNRFAPEFALLLPEAGLKALSVMAPTDWPELPAEVVSIDVHLDPVAWREHGGFLGTDAVLGRLVGEMRTRRMTHRWQSGAIGILTHHLIMDDLTADFIERLSAVIRRHTAARWIAPAETLLPV
jgi:hypothetical protein